MCNLDSSRWLHLCQWDQSQKSLILVYKVINFQLHGQLEKLHLSTSLEIDLIKTTLGSLPFCVSSKILERHVHIPNKIEVFQNCLLYLYQSGFRAFHACETPCRRLVDMWTLHMEKGLLNAIISIRPQKAFDLVDTDVLLEKLRMVHVLLTG